MRINFKSLCTLFILSILTISLYSQNGKYDDRPLHEMFSSKLKYDSLTIEKLNGQKIKLVWRYRKNIHKDVPWKQLLQKFQEDFKKVIADIPDYEFYKINYSQNKQMVIDEIRGREIYTVNPEEDLKYIRSNYCKIVGEELQLLIEFNEKEELVEPLLMTNIEEAVSKIKHKFYFSTVSEDRHYYSLEQSKMMPKPKKKLKFFIPVGARAGFVKNKPYVELRPGVGLQIGHDNYISLNTNFVLAYDEITQSTQSDLYVGFVLSSLGAGFGSEFAVKVSEGIDDFDDFVFRSGLNYKTKNGITMGVDYYLAPTRFRSDATFIWGFSLGFGF